MTRRQFGGTPADFVASVGADGTLKVVPDASVTLWTAPSGGLRVTDLLDGNNNPATTIVADADGQIGLFHGPDDGSSALWADAGGGTRSLLLASDGSDSTAILQCSQLIVRASAGQTGQLIQTFDENGAPITGTPLAGGPFVIGDNWRVFAGADLFNAEVEAYGSNASTGSLRMRKGDLAGGVGVFAMGDCTSPPSGQPDGTNIVEGAQPVAGSVIFSRSGRIYGLPGSGAVEELGLPTLRRVQSVQADVAAATVTTQGVAAATLSGTAANADDPLACSKVGLTTAASIGAVAAVVPASFSQVVGAWQPMWWARIVTGSAITSCRLWAGLFSAAPSAVSSPTGLHCAAFRYDTGVDGTAFWRCVTSAASATPTVVTAGQAIAASTMYDLRVEWNHFNSKIRFLINDRVVAVVTTTMPTYNQYLAGGVWLTALAASARTFGFSRSVMSHAG